MSHGYGYGGDKIVSEAFGIDPRTVSAGRKAIEAGKIDDINENRIRQVGGGRKQAKDLQPELLKNIEDIVRNNTYRDPEQVLFWTNLSLRDISEELKSHKSMTPAQARLELIFLNLEFDDIDHIKEADRLNPNATMANIIFEQQEGEDTIVDKAKALKEVRNDKDINNIISLAENGMKLLTDIKDDGNKSRAIMTLLYAENGDQFARNLYTACYGGVVHLGETGPLLQWFDYFDNSLGTRRSFEEKMMYATDKVAAGLISEMHGVNLNEILFKEIYIMTLDAVESYYSDLIKGIK